NSFSTSLSVMLLQSVVLLILILGCTNGIECPEVRNTILDSATRADIVNRHNELRSMLARGTVTCKDRAPLKAGKNVYQLHWDCDLEEKAQNWADLCLFKHSPASYREAGENLYEYLSSRDIDPLEWNATEVVNTWWSEVTNYDVISNPSNKFSERVLEQAGHWSQQAWGATTSIGCGIKICSWLEWNIIIVVCHYRVPGNVFGEPIFEWGDGCSEDSDCTTYEGSKCNATTKLCM
uniref:SCP domain-containing protein n=1 Tax=Parascaris univalens TaxID=6257 RepID=A0A915BU37_PARUN